MARDRILSNNDWNASLSLLFGLMSGQALLASVTMINNSYQMLYFGDFHIFTENEDHSTTLMLVAETDKHETKDQS